MPVSHRNAGRAQVRCRGVPFGSPCRLVPAHECQRAVTPGFHARCRRERVSRVTAASAALMLGAHTSAQLARRTAWRVCNMVRSQVLTRDERQSRAHGLKSPLMCSHCDPTDCEHYPRSSRSAYWEHDAPASPRLIIAYHGKTAGFSRYTRSTGHLRGRGSCASASCTCCPRDKHSRHIGSSPTAASTRLARLEPSSPRV